MEFCQKCNGMILVDKDKAICMNCGYKQKKKPKKAKKTPARKKRK